MADNRSCGQAIASLLEASGVDTVFGIPGVHTLELYRGLADSNIRHVLARHEQGAGFMADGYARASGRPGVCYVITGPGVTNIATPLGQACSDSVPILVISSVNDTRDLGRGRGRLHEIADQQAVTAPLTGFSALATRAEEIPSLINHAFASFAADRPRPAHISVPLDVLAAQARGNWTPGAMAPCPTPAEEDLARLRSMLAAAEKPLILLGGGAVDLPQPDLLRFVEECGATVISTAAGKGVFPELHRRSLGASLALAPTQELFAAADLVLAVGTELAETDWWLDELPRPAGQLVRVDIAASQLALNLPAELAIQTDAGAFLAALGPVSNPRDPERQASVIADTMERNAREAGPRARKHRAVLEVVRAALPSDGFVATDMTQIAYSGNSMFPVDRPRSWFHPQGFGTLGYALPAAIGARLAQPDRPGMAIAGDFGFQFTLPELATAVELGLPLPILLWNNEGLEQIRGDMVAQGIPEIGVRARNPDFQALARAYGAEAVLPESLDTLGSALRASLSAPGPTLIEVREDMKDLEEIGQK